MTQAAPQAPRDAGHWEDGGFALHEVGTAPPACVPRGGDMSHAAQWLHRDAGNGGDEGRARTDWARSVDEGHPLID